VSDCVAALRVRGVIGHRRIVSALLLHLLCHCFTHCVTASLTVSLLNRLMWSNNNESS
jgi:hypothetical protein